MQSRDRTTTEGNEGWVKETAKQLGLESTLRSGEPRPTWPFGLEWGRIM